MAPVTPSIVRERNCNDRDKREREKGGLNDYNMNLQQEVHQDPKSERVAMSELDCQPFCHHFDRGRQLHQLLS